MSIQCYDYDGAIGRGRTPGYSDRLWHQPLRSSRHDPKKMKLSFPTAPCRADFAANKALFPDPTPGTFGTSARNIVNEPGIENFVLGLYKNTDITEHAKFQLRFEAFNAFNHPQFYVDPRQFKGAAIGDEQLPAIAGNLETDWSRGKPRILQISGKFIF